jgi:hypothetical protein
MGFSTGASKAKREFKKQETKAYYDALNKLEEAKPVKKIDTQSARKLNDSMDGDLSYGTKRLAMKADKIGRAINADPNLNNNIKAYNERFNEVKRQMKGETVTRYQAVTPEGPRSNTYMGIGGSTAGNIVNGTLTPQGNGVMDILNGKSPQESPITIALRSQNALYLPPSSQGTYATKEEALAAYKAPPQDARKIGMFATLGLNTPQAPAPELKEVKLGNITGSYRELGSTKAAYKDMERLAKEVGDNPAAKMTKEYEVLGNQLKAKLKRETNGIMTGQPQGLLTSELATGAPKQEVIQ